MPDVFISYSRREPQGEVSAFERKLGQQLQSWLGEEVVIWRDDKIRAGDDWQRCMLEAAAGSSVFVLLVSKGSVKSQWCREELLAFLKTHPDGPVVPVRLDEVDPPHEARRFQAIDLFSKQPDGHLKRFAGPKLKERVDYLAQDIEKILASPPPPQIDAIVARIRQRVTPEILEQCGKMRILDMEHPMDSAALYTKVNLLEKITARNRDSQHELHQKFRLEDFVRFGLGAVVKRLDALEMVQQSNRLMILGKPGAGKTTLLRRVAYLCAKGNRWADMVPAFLEFRKLGTLGIQERLRDEWGEDPLPVLRAGRALLLLDGLDEVPADRVSSVRQEIDDLARRAGHSRVLVTCRIAASEYTFEPFTEVEVSDFDEEQIAEFAGKWFAAKGHPDRAASFLTKLKENRPISELAQSPLLLAMMCLLFERRPDFDADRAEIYKDALDVLLRKWDAKRAIPRDAPYKGLTLQRKQQMLMGIARERFERNEYLFERASLEEQVTSFFRQAPEAGEIDAAVILDAMEAQHGLLVERARDIYSFSHLTLQEYFTARSIVDAGDDQDRWKPLLSHLYEPRWREVFLLVAGMLTPPDALLERMQRTIDEGLRARPRVQKFLEWLNRKSASVAAPCRPAAVRAAFWKIASRGWVFVYGEQPHFDFALGRDLGPDPDVARVIDLAFALALARYSALDLDRAIDLERAFDLDIDRARNLVFDLGRYRASDLDRFLTRELDRALDRARKAFLPLEFQLTLERLQKRASDGTFDRKCANELRQAMIEHRDIGHDFGFDDEDEKCRDNAFQAFRLLVDCMNASRVTPAARERIEERFMRPWDAAWPNG